MNAATAMVWALILSTDQGPTVQLQTFNTPDACVTARAELAQRIPDKDSTALRCSPRPSRGWILGFTKY